MIRCAFSPNALSCYLGLIPWPAYALLAAATGLLLWVFFDKIKAIFDRIVKWGGWRAGLAAVLGAVALIVTFWPRKRPAVHTDDIFPDTDKPKRKKRPTIFDGLRK